MALRNGNPVLRLGNARQRDFTKVPNDLIRHGVRNGLTANAVIVMVLLMSHADGHKTSAMEMSLQLGWGENRTRVNNALALLVKEGLLVIREHQNEQGKRVRKEYVFYADARQFTDAERQKWSRPVTLPPRGVRETCTVEAVRNGGQSASAPAVFDEQSLRQLHAAVVSQQPLRIEARATTWSPYSLLPPTLYPQPIGPQHEGRLLDRLPVAATDSPAIEYVKHLSTTGAAAVTAEGDPKPELTLNYDKVIIQMVKLAAHTAASREALSDFTSFAGYVTSELSRLLTDVENDALINGVTGLDGFLNTSGILTHTVATSPAETPLDAIEASIATLRVGPALATANLLVLHPSTWSAVRRSKDDQHRYLVTADPTTDTASSAWGVPVLVTTQISPGLGLMLDTRKAGRVWQREGLSLRTGYANDDLTRNLTRFVVEERLNLACERPAAVLKITELPAS
jgi:predicted transcriptional regulator